MTKALVLAAMLLTVLAAVHPLAASDQSKPAGSLCQAPDVILFSCKVGAKLVSICDQGRSGAVYRFGRPGHIELEAINLHRALKGWSGDGEMQVYADTPTHRYIVYDRIVRTGSGEDGHNDPKETLGLLVQSGGRTVASWECALDASFDQRSETIVPEGEYVPH